MKLSSLLPRTGKYTAIAASGSGLLVALAVILIFIITATWLKSVFFGLIFAYLALPFEQLLEKIFFRSRGARIVSLFFSALFAPARRLRRALMRRANIQPPADSRKTVENAIAGKASGITLLLLLLLFCGGIYGAVSVAIPYVEEKGAEAARKLKESETVNRWVRTIDEKLAAEQAQTAEQESPAPAQNRAAFLKEKLVSLLQMADISWIGTLFNSGTDVLAGVLGFFSAAGGFAFDLLMFFFFFFFFLQRMAFYRNSLREKTAGSAGDTGRWMVDCIARSGWFPAMDAEVQESAAGIMARIFQMFNAWLRGYGLIILVEWILYTAFFFFFGVPYAVPLALIASMTILLPFLGPVIGFSLAFLVTLIFTPALLPLIGVCAAYLLINGVLEQLFLYPVLVGESIGLTTLETIVAVLFGAVIAGITGMILAVPAAALLKFLMPLVYDMIRKNSRTPEKTESDLAL